MTMAIRKTLLCAAGAALLAAAAGDAWPRSGSHHGFHHHHHHHVRVFFGGFFVGAPLWGPYYRPYYYGPDYAARSEPPKVYVERFDGQPTPQTQGEIFCPGAGEHYPAVTQCPGGWQRVIRPEG
jgi:hypothetical protein